MVIAVPAALIVEGDEEQVVAIEPLEDGSAVAASGDGVAQRSGQPVEDRGLQEEGPDIVGLAGEDLVDEIVHDEPVVAGERGDERRGVGPALHREGRELERSDPALGPCLERRNVGPGELEAHRAVQVRGGLLGCKAQVGGPDLDQLSADAESGKR
jgi:hypothetical protein